MSDEKWVYDFAEGSKEMRDLLGGKGANVAEMTRVLGTDRVPAGFTITTEACVAYMKAGSEPDGLEDQVTAALARLEETAGKKFGDDEDPLLVSVRSGARESMPGMLDTILNVGLNDTSVSGLANATDNERFAWDSYRRLIQMFGNVVHGVKGERFEDAIAAAKREAGVETDAELPVDALRKLVEQFKGFYEFPEDPQEQLHQAIRAVFDSWTGERAVSYRRINRIPDDWGTAVNVQQMVFGNKGDGSATGVAFSRDEVTGAPEPSGDFLVNAQGEDVVSGVRTPRDISELRDVMPEAHEQLMDILRTLESEYKDMQDVEFTVEEGQLYMLQTRNAKRPAQAAVRFAVDAVDEGLLTREQALSTINPGSLDALLHPTFDRSDGYEVLASGVAASPGAAAGQIVFSAADAVSEAQAGNDVILVRPFTEADDVAGFHAARGILTSEGGKASHAALVARGMGVPAVTGAHVAIDLEAGELTIDGRTFKAGDQIAIDGSEGAVVEPGAKLIEPEIDERFDTILEWADEFRRLGVRVNADTPEDAQRARELGAEGIGLCRTEHMFMAEDRQPKMRAMIMADDRDGRRSALRELLPLQEEDFVGLFQAMRGLPVTIRLHDPPLHEFLPNLPELRAHVERARIEVTDDLDELEKLLTRVEEIHEGNPMLGTRGVRLGILYPEIYEMQVHAIMRAAKRIDEPPHPEIMIPLVAYEHELEIARELVVSVGSEYDMRAGEDYTVGTMIELPRACFIANLIAKHADFFSFGTNDLTQTALGFSRDDVESKFIPTYIEDKIIDRSPFETIDSPGVGWLVRLAAWVGREAHPGLKLGICGEHGGDPDSVGFFHR
ncbi:MAG TPA: pyruvate, phosphate dikinase, partial [Solirubrobacteraceae bacterium]|nr:pyruvate, phosphate dikinase [Solirubrobacteraceae bacterium]